MLSKKKFDSKIDIYYQEDLNYSFAQAIINYIWFNKDSEGYKFELIKDDKSGINVYRLCYNKKVYYIKSYFHRKFIKTIKNLFRPAEAVRYLLITNKLNAVNIPSFEPLLALTYKRSIFIVDSIFVMKEVKGISFADYLKSNQFEKEEKEELTKKFGQIWGRLFRFNFLHKDPSPVNFIVNTNKKHMGVNLIDVDNIYKVPFLPKLFKIRSLAVFEHKTLIDIMKNNKQGFTYQGCMIFYKELIKNYKRSIMLEKFISQAFKELFKRILRKNDFYLICENEYLYNIYNQKVF